MKQAPIRLKKTSSESLSDRAYRELKKHILENKLTLGYQYTEQEVAELLHMSRTPTREAFLRLANEGLIEIRPRHGMRIKPISVHDMLEIYRILTSLESCAAELAARRGLSKTEIELLCKAVNEIQRPYKLEKPSVIRGCLSFAHLRRSPGIGELEPISKSHEE